MGYLEDVNVAFQDTFSIDAFGRLRVSELTTQFDGKQIHDNLPLFYDIETVGTGNSSHSTTNAESTMTTSGGGDAVITQTKQRFNYMTGKSCLGMQTFRNFDHETNITKRIGYFNSSTSTPFTSSFDGFYLESDGSSINFVIAKGGTKNTISQDSWNIDTVNGNGKSGLDLDLGTETGNFLFWWNFEWLGVGAVTFGFVHNNVFYQCHREDHILGDGIYMESPNHSLRSEIRQSGAGSGTFINICSTFNIEGAANVIGKDGGITDNKTKLNANSTSNWYYAIGLRLQEAKVDSLIDVLDASLMSTTNDSFEWRICINPTYASTVTYNDVSDYSISYGLGSQSNTVSAFGHILKGGHGYKQSVTPFDLKTAIRLGVAIDGTLDEIVICVRPLSNGLDLYRGVNWRELS